MSFDDWKESSSLEDYQGNHVYNDEDDCTCSEVPCCDSDCECLRCH